MSDTFSGGTVDMALVLLMAIGLAVSISLKILINLFAISVILFYA